MHQNWRGLSLGKLSATRGMSDDDDAPEGMPKDYVRGGRRRAVSYSHMATTQPTEARHAAPGLGGRKGILRESHVRKAFQQPEFLASNSASTITASLSEDGLGGEIPVSFVEAGPLGLKFSECEGRIQLLQVEPGTQAEKHSELCPGLTLIQIDDIPCGEWTATFGSVSLHLQLSLWSGLFAIVSFNRDIAAGLNELNFQAATEMLEDQKRPVSLLFQLVDMQIKCGWL